LPQPGGSYGVIGSVTYQQISTRWRQFSSSGSWDSGSRAATAMLPSRRSCQCHHGMEHIVGGAAVSPRSRCRKSEYYRSPTKPPDSPSPSRDRSLVPVCLSPRVGAAGRAERSLGVACRGAKLARRYSCPCPCLARQFPPSWEGRCGYGVRQPTQTLHFHGGRHEGTLWP